MTENIEKIKSLQERLKFLEETVPKIKEQLKFERENTPEDVSVLEERIIQIKAEDTRLANEINQKKTVAKDAKDQITKLKADHDNFSLPEGEPEEDLNRLKLENWYKITEEIKSLGNIITQTEGEISTICTSKNHLEQALLKGESTLDIVKRGYFNRAIEEDPRLNGLLDEIKKVKIELQVVSAES